MRKILIELQIDWEGYEDVSDELIVEDAIEAKVEGVGWALLRQPPVIGSLPPPVKLICKNCGDWYGININHKCYKCLQDNFVQRQ